MRLDLGEAFTAEVKPPKWIVEGVVPAGTIVLVAGDPGVGKSVLSLAQGLHVALGLPYLGFKTHQTRVLYFDQENSKPDLTEYLRQLWAGLGRPNPAILNDWMRVEHYSLGYDWHRRAAPIVREWQPGLIFVDTAASAFGIEDENDNAEAQAAIQGLRGLIGLSAEEPAIEILKHAKFQTGGGHGGETRRTIRGAKTWLGAVDQVLYHIRRPGRPGKDGLRDTLLVPDKSRAFGLRNNILIRPEYVGEEPSKGLILKGELYAAGKDLMVVE